MWLMQILQKRINKVIVLVLLLGLGLLTGCSVSDTKNETTKQSLSSSTTSQEKIDVSPYLNAKVITNMQTPIYDASKQEIGVIEKDSLLQTTSQSVDEYVEIEDGMYVKTDSIEPIEYLDYYDNHLVRLGKKINIKDVQVYDESFHVVFKLTIDTYKEIVYESPEHYGFLFQKDMVLVKKQDVSEIVETTPEPYASEVPVLMYHFFYDETNNEVAKDNNHLDVTKFEQQLSALKELNYQTLTMKELDYILDGYAKAPEKSFVITIDDGDPSVYKYAYPVIKKYNYNATLFLIAGWLDPQLEYPFIEMREHGLELQSHSFLLHTGGCLGKGSILCIDFDKGVQDTIQSLEYVDGGYVYCYPFGHYNQHAIDILKAANVKMAFTTEYGKVKYGMDKWTLPRVRVSGTDTLEGFLNKVKG